jgi:hypothetical protein
MLVQSIVGMPIGAVTGGWANKAVREVGQEQDGEKPTTTTTNDKVGYNRDGTKIAGIALYSLLPACWLWGRLWYPSCLSIRSY